MMLTLCDHLLKHPRFVRYPQALKDDMRQEGVVKILKNLHNMKGERKQSFFAYWTITAWSAFMDTLTKYFKEYNNRRELTLETLERIQCQMPTVGKQIVLELEAQLKRLSEGEYSDEYKD